MPTNPPGAQSPTAPASTAQPPTEKRCVVCNQSSHRTDWLLSKSVTIPGVGTADFVACDNHTASEFALAVDAVVNKAKAAAPPPDKLTKTPTQDPAHGADAALAPTPKTPTQAGAVGQAGPTAGVGKAAPSGVDKTPSGAGQPNKSAEQPNKSTGSEQTSTNKTPNAGSEQNKAIGGQQAPTSSQGQAPATAKPETTK